MPTIPTTTAFEPTKIFSKSVPREELEALIRGLFRHSVQSTYLCEFILQLHEYMSAHNYVTPEVTITQGKKGEKGPFVPGVFEITIHSMPDSVDVLQLPQPQLPLPLDIKFNKITTQVEGSIASKLRIVYTFTLEYPVRNSVSVRPKVEKVPVVEESDNSSKSSEDSSYSDRDRSPNRSASASSEYSVESSEEVIEKPKAPKKKKGNTGWFASLLPGATKKKKPKKKK